MRAGALLACSPASRRRAAGFPAASPEGSETAQPITLGEEFPLRGLDAGGWLLDWKDLRASLLCWCPGVGVLRAGVRCAAGDSVQAKKNRP